MGGTQKNLPDSVRPFFWDVDFDRLSSQDNSFFIISRLLEHGDEPAARFLLKTYGEDEITHVVRTSRSLISRYVNAETWQTRSAERPVRGTGGGP